MLNHRVRVEFDSVEERTHVYHDGYPMNVAPYLVVKLRIYNRGLFRLKGEIVSMFGNRWTAKQRRNQGCVIRSQWLDGATIDLPGRLSRLRKIFRNSSKSESDEPEFFIYEIVRQEPARLLTLKIYSSVRFFNEDSWVSVPKYFRRFRLTESARMNELEDQIAEEKMTANVILVDGFEVIEHTGLIAALINGEIKYTREELEENFKNAFDV